MRFFLLTFIAMALPLSTEARYQRKPPQAPEYFVPASALPQPEKLPPMRFRHQNQNDESQKTYAQMPAEQVENDDSHISAADTAETQNFTTPKYQQKYDLYHKDLQEFSRTKKMPRRYDIGTDLKKMSTDDEFEVGG